MFTSFYFFGLVYYLVFWILVLTFYFLFIFLCMNHRAKLSARAILSLVHFWPVPMKDQNPCKIDPSCKIDPRAIVTLRAVLSPRAKVSSCSFVPSCSFVSVQFYLRAVLCPRAVLTPCNCGSVHFSPLVQFRHLVHFWRSCIFDRDPINLAVRFNL